MLRHFTPLAIFCMGLAPPAHATGEDAVKPAVLVELFTSEGCSSCPPADALLRQMNGTTSAGGQLIVGISEHVTYWNNLGWADPFSSDTFTARQSAYSNRFRLDSVYTPQMVVNGNEQVVGSDRVSLERALQRQKQRPQVPVHIVSTAVEGRTLTIAFSVGGPAGGSGIDIMAVLADDLDRSSVLRGENSGRTLSHAAVARTFANIATVHGATEKSVQLPLPAAVDLTKGGHHLILFAQASGQGQVLGTDSRPL